MSVGLNLSSKGKSDLLETVADTHDGDTGSEDGGVDVRSVGSVHRVGRAGEDDSCSQMGFAT